MSDNLKKEAHELAWDSILTMNFEEVRSLSFISDLEKIIFTELQDVFCRSVKTCTECRDFLLDYEPLLFQNPYWFQLKDFIEEDSIYCYPEEVYMKQFRSLCIAIKDLVSYYYW